MSPADEVNSALISSGFGKFNIIVLLIAIPGSWAIMFATSTISFIVGRAECDLKLSLGDIGTLNGMPYIGMLIFTIPWAILSDNIGRRKVAIISYILDGFIVLLCSFSQTKYELIILKFLNGATICGAFSVLMTYVSEVHTGIMRTRALYFIGICLTVAPLLLPTMAVVIVPKKWEISYGGFNYYSWNLFLLISASPSLICGVAFIFMPESPKFDAAKNNFNKALKTLQTIFKMNTGKSIEEYPIKSLVTEEVSEELTMKQRFQEGWSRFTEMFQKKYIFLALNIFFVEFCILMCQNSFRLWLPKIFETMKQFQEEGKSVNSFCDVLSMVQSSSVAKQHGKCESNITWESYINNFYVAIASVLGFIITAILLTVINPKKLFSASLGVSLIFSMVLIVATNEVSIVSLIAIYLAAENIASTSVFNACLHLFPTNLRNTVLGFGMTLGRLGSFIGNRIFPYIISFNCIVFFVWIGVLGAEKMKINAKMATPIEEKIEKNLKVRIGMVNVSDGKCKPEPLRLKLSMEVLILQKVELVTPTSQSSGPPMKVKERMVQITRQKQGGLGLSIKGGAEHKLPILISRIYKDQAADISGQLFVGDAIIKVNGEYITACPHDDAVNILRNAGDIVVLTLNTTELQLPFCRNNLQKIHPIQIMMQPALN